MECPHCGETVAAAPDGHRCLDRRPTVGWQVARWSVVVVAVGYGLATLVQFWLALSADRQVGQVQPGDSSVVRGQYLADIRRLVSVAVGVEFASWGLLLLLIAALIGWRVVSGNLVRTRGCDDVRGMLRHWSFRAWSGFLVVSVMLAYGAGVTRSAVDGVDAVQGRLRLMETRYLLRVVAIAFLVFGLVQVSRRIRRFLADPTAPVVPEPLMSAGPRPPATLQQRQRVADAELWGWEPSSSTMRSDRCE